ncbi:hypothetical protein [Mycoplasma suis]|uniref:hypothetical protein n=1 Tax=Mycoplasma suis TaxID=57372 RepID=UPI0013053C5C|nr:hypothetical protein [Mycoplasma suis]
MLAGSTGGALGTGYVFMNKDLLSGKINSQSGNSGTAENSKSSSFYDEGEWWRYGF